MIIIRCETGDDVTVPGDTLIGADLSGKNLHRALLEDAIVSGSNFSQSHLRSARIERAKFDHCDLTGANLGGWCFSPNPEKLVAESLGISP